MLNLFKKHKSTIICSPVDGELIDISKVSDPTFAEKMLGDGVAIIPHSNDIASPATGEVAMVFDTHHAASIVTNGIELLIHCGIDTVNLKGRCFEAHTENGAKISTGDALLTMDVDGVRESGYDTVIPIIVLNTPEMKSITPKAYGPVKAGDPIMEIEIQ
jgi:PTS system beta-glucosides-specific IIC component